MIIFLRNTKISISCGPTSGTLESIAYNCFLLCPVLEPFEKKNLEILKIPKSNYKLVYSKVELEKEMLLATKHMKLQALSMRLLEKETLHTCVGWFSRRLCRAWSR